MSGSVLILGATSGIGRALARRWASERVPLVLAARDAEELRRTAADLAVRYNIPVATVPFDALAFETHDAFFRECVARAPDGLDGLFLCYGYLASQAEAQADFAVAKRVLDTNYTSAVSVLNLAADYFEKRGRGCVCALSSVAGDRGRQSNYVYGSAKAGLGTYLEGLQVRLFKAGVRVLTVKPGFVDTGMTWGLPGMFLVATPDRVADDVWRAVRKGRSVLYTPWFWRIIMGIIGAIPRPIFRRLKL